MIVPIGGKFAIEPSRGSCDYMVVSLEISFPCAFNRDDIDLILPESFSYFIGDKGCFLCARS